MRLTGNTILITGGASGIGLGLTKRFLEAGNQVIICGRRPDQLMEVKERYPGVHTKVCDIADELSRRELYNWVTGTFPAVNVLINNAGIQQRINLLGTGLEWSYCHQEIAANFEAPTHLSMMFVEHFIRQPQASIINVTSARIQGDGSAVSCDLEMDTMGRFVYLQLRFDRIDDKCQKEIGLQQFWVIAIYSRRLIIPPVLNKWRM